MKDLGSITITAEPWIRSPELLTSCNGQALNLLISCLGQEQVSARTLTDFT
jgi:hypothetical protein